MCCEEEPTILAKAQHSWGPSENKKALKKGKRTPTSESLLHRTPKPYKLLPALTETQNLYSKEEPFHNKGP